MLLEWEFRGFRNCLKLFLFELLCLENKSGASAISYGQHFCAGSGFCGKRRRGGSEKTPILAPLRKKTCRLRRTRFFSFDEDNVHQELEGNKLSPLLLQRSRIVIAVVDFSWISSVQVRLCFDFASVALETAEFYFAASTNPHHLFEALPSSKLKKLSSSSSDHERHQQANH